MAYGVKYWFEFNDEWDRVHKVEILNDGYGGASTELTKVGIPPVLITKPSDGTKFQPVQGKEIALKLLSTSDLQFSEFFTATNRAYLIKYYIATVLNFSGYLVPDQYYEPFIAPAYTVTLRATDGLGDLKNRLFESAVDTPYTGQEDLLDVIEICLDETGLALDIISACNFFETGHNKTDADDPLPQTYINQEVYREDWKTGWSCYDVLVDIMTLIGGKLEQINGAWHIIPIRELAETSYDYRVYNSSGTYQSNSSKSPQLTVTVPTAGEATLCCWSGDNQMLEIIPAYKEFTLLQDYGYRENIIENHSFEPDQWSDANTPLLWTKSEAGAWIRRYSDFAWMDSPAANIGVAKYIYQLPANAKLELAGSYTLKITYKAKVILGGTGSIQIKLDTGAAQRYLDDDGSWNAGVVYLNFTNTGLVEIEVDTAAIPLDAANLTITCYEVVRGVPAGIAFDYLKIEIIPAGGAYFPEENELREKISTNYNFIPSEKTVNIGDLPGKNNEEAAYWGGLLNSSGIALSSWEHKGDADWDTLLDHIVADIKNNYDAPTHKLRGSIHSKVMDFNTVLKEDNLSNKIFIPGQMTYNPLRGLWTGEWLEVVTN